MTNAEILKEIAVFFFCFFATISQKAPTDVMRKNHFERAMLVALFYMIVNG